MSMLHPTLPAFSPPPRLFWPLALAFSGVTFFVGYVVQRTDFEAFIFSYSLFFGLYLWAVFAPNKLPVAALVALGIALRALLLFSMPNLSDDYARFLWDGRLTVSGYHPFLYIPRYFIDNHIALPGITPELFHRLNSPDYYTVYPPVCQAVFAVAAWIAPQNDWLAVVLLKVFLFACELGTIALLWKAKDRAPRAAVLYALNPLAILEVVGNCHFEGAMIFFLLAGMTAMREGKVARPAVYWALATASKMLPIMFLPLAWRWLGWRKGLIFNVVFGVSMLVLFAPLLAVWSNIAQSLDLYFREFQFNASIYYLVRQVGYWKIGWDIGEFSGPRLAAVAAGGILLMSLWARNKGNRLELVMLFSLFLYLSCAAVVQPWYVLVPLAISTLTHWRFAVIWTGVVALSYSHYKNNAYLENYTLIALEYSILWVFFMIEIILKRP